MSYSQDLQPKKIQYNKQEGLFISFALMDTIAFKLIDRKTLKSQSLTLSQLYKVLNEKNKVIEEQLDISKKSSTKWQILYEKAKAQGSIYQNSIKQQEEILKQTKKKHRRRSLMLFGGGVAVGVSVFAILIN